MRALPGLRAAVAFSSIAGRFGNAGQSDYAAANDLLCKLAAHLGQARPGVRGIALDWTGWGGIGMATRGSIPKILEAAGIDLLPPELGIPVTRRELEAATTGEVLVAGRLGAMTAPLHPEGGLGELWTALGRARIDAEGLELRLRLQAEAPFLDHHRIEGTPVLPGVMGVEAFVEAATLAAPGWRAIAVEELSFGAPLKLYRDEEREASVRLRVRPEGEELIAACVLTSSRGTAVGEQRVEHFRGRVRLARTAPTPTRVELPEPGPTLGPEAIYAVYFHGPAFRVIEAAGPAGDGVLARMPASLPPSMPEPSRAGPRQLEAVFQAAGLGAIGREGRMGLPTSVRRIRLVDPAPDAEGGLLVLARPGAAGWDAVVADAEGRVRMEVEGYATVDLGPVEPAKLAPFARFG